MVPILVSTYLPAFPHHSSSAITPPLPSPRLAYVGVQLFRRPKDEELKLLRGTSLHALTTVWKSQVANDLRELQELELPSEGSSTAQSALEGFLTKEGYQWALATVSREMKRAFLGPL